MNQSPFFKEIPPGPIGPLPDENAPPSWFKAAWVLGIAGVLTAVAGGFYLLSGPDSKIGPEIFEVAETEPKKS